MRVTVFGAGAIGGVIAATLAGAGHEVSLVARGRTLAALRETGLTLVRDGTATVLRLPVTEDPADLGPQDVAILAVKAHSLRPVLPALMPLLGDDTVVVPAINGIPWWYFHGTDQPAEPLQSVDHSGELLEALDPARILGCVVHFAAWARRPGEVVHASGDRLVLGEPDGSASARLQRVAELFRAGGFRVEATPEIRREIWSKAWGNATFNPASVLTGATVRELCEDDSMAPVLRAVMAEIRDVAAAQGVTMPMSIDERLQVARKVGDFKSSMLQDLEAGRALELDAILGAVIELAHRSGIAVPALETLYGLADLRSRLALASAATP